MPGAAVSESCDQREPEPAEPMRLDPFDHWYERLFAWFDCHFRALWFRLWMPLSPPRWWVKWTRRKKMR